MGWSKYLLKWKKNSNDIQGWIIYRYLFLVFRGPINPRAFRTTRCVVRLEIFLARMHGSMLVTENSSSLTLIFLCLVTCQVISSLTHTQKKRGSEVLYNWGPKLLSNEVVRSINFQPISQRLTIDQSAERTTLTLSQAIRNRLVGFSGSSCE